MWPSKGSEDPSLGCSHSMQACSVQRTHPRGWSSKRQLGGSRGGLLSGCRSRGRPRVAKAPEVTAGSPGSWAWSVARRMSRNKGHLEGPPDYSAPGQADLVLGASLTLAQVSPGPRHIKDLPLTQKRLNLSKSSKFQEYLCRVVAAAGERSGERGLSGLGASCLQGAPPQTQLSAGLGLHHSDKPAPSPCAKGRWAARS